MLTLKCREKFCVSLRDGILFSKINEGIYKLQNVPAVAVPLDLLAS